VTSAPTAYFEKIDLHRVLDVVEPGPIVPDRHPRIGRPRVALQEASQDRRVVAVVAAETFSSDLRTVCDPRRAPFFFTRGHHSRAAPST